MNIEKVKNGFIVEIDTDDPYKPEKYICDNLTALLNLINAHYGEVGMGMQVMDKLKPGKIVEID